MNFHNHGINTKGPGSPAKFCAMFFLLIIPAILSSGCTKPMVLGQERVAADHIAISTSGDDKILVYKMITGENKIVSAAVANVIDSLNSTVTSIKNIDDKTVIAITQKNGIFIISNIDKPAEIKLTHIRVGADALPDNKLRDAVLISGKKDKKLYVTYYTPGGIGVTECTLGKNWESVQCKTITKTNSQLRDNFVHEVAGDMKGNVWFRYSPGEKDGVSRLSPAGEWSHFTHQNSELASADVNIIKVEKPGEGLPGDNIWFATKNGLSSLTYTKDGKEVWRLYGKKYTTGDMVLRLVGLEDRFTEAALNIVSVEMEQDLIVFANNKALYLLTTDNLNSMPSDDVGGLDENYITRMFCRNNKAVVTIASKKSGRQIIKSVRGFDLKKRVWEKIDVWGVKKAFASEAVFTPLTKTTDFVSLSYMLTAPAYGIYDYGTGAITRIEMSNKK